MDSELVVSRFTVRFVGCFALFFAAALIAYDFAALDRDEGSGVADLAQALRDFVGDELAVGKNLKVAIGMSREQINRQLSAWADTGVIALKGGRVTILDREALMDVAEAW